IIFYVCIAAKFQTLASKFATSCIINYKKQIFCLTAKSLKPIGLTQKQWGKTGAVGTITLSAIKKRL
ncbi:MAG: hypothetical protein MRZ91_06325, partial [Christensenellaceae bacterium]|nr:hypothetical protein [Christensenellaceae bacterium]